MQTPMRPSARSKDVTRLLVLSLLLGACGSAGNGDQPRDPVQEDIAIAWISRPLPLQNDAGGIPQAIARDLAEPAAFRPGARLIVRERASPDAPERIITDRLFGPDALYDVKDVEVSWDGKKMLFALRAPAVENSDTQPTWDIWEYNRDTDQLRRIIQSDIAEAQGEDIAPHYLADGRVVFASTRQLLTRATQLDEGKPQYPPQGEARRGDSFALHVMDSDGSNITQLTFNTSHAIDPVVDSEGHIIYVRWDNVDGHDAFNLYRLRPDGSGHELWYGSHSHDTGNNGANVDFRDLRQSPDGRLLAMIGPRQDRQFGGQWVYLDTAGFSDNDRPLPDSSSRADTAQQAATHFPASSDGEAALGGFLSTVWPVQDGSGRLLIGWSECMLDLGEQTLPCTEERLALEGAVLQRPAYGLWMYDPANASQLPLVLPVADRVISDAVVLQSRPLPPAPAAPVHDGRTYDETLAADNVGLLHIRSVYDLDGEFFAAGSNASDLASMMALPVNERPTRFLRLEKAVHQPDADTREVPDYAFGLAGGQGMREILGYAPIEPDGSVKVMVTANVPFTLSILDGEGKRLHTRHNTWLHLAPGEIVTCNGCHDPASETPHGRADATPASTNPGAAVAGSIPGLRADWSALPGETLADTRNRLEGTDAARPSADIIFDDIWSVTPAASFVWRYSDLGVDTEGNALTSPASASCAPVWTALCRIVTAYPQHIAPLWDKPRALTDSNGQALSDSQGQPVTTCVACHAPGSSVFGAQGPLQSGDSNRTQLDLRNQPSEEEPGHLQSYRALLYPQIAQELDADGNLVPKPQRDAGGAIVCETNEGGQPRIDPDTGVCVAPVYEQVSAPVQSAGAQASEAFFRPFASDGSHAGWLNAAELKMLSEWIDLGAQYYNDPFAAPQD